MHRPLIYAHGFTLVELTVVLVIGALILGGLTLSLTAIRDLTARTETQKQLTEIKEALLGFAAINARLPCPASATSNGQESFCNNATGSCGSANTLSVPTETPAHGRCSHYFTGFLPGATLGLPGLDANGFMLDGWGSPSNRFRYAVADNAINNIGFALTTAGGMKAATMAKFSEKQLLSVCSSATNASANSCQTGTLLSNSAVAVIFSPGGNAATGGLGGDEAENLDGDAVFVSHPPSGAESAGGNFDDLVTWISPNILFNRMIAAGRLP